MPEIDIQTYQKKAAATAAGRAMITPERSQKLDLLIHLLSNLQQSLIVCGPKGIGKTTLLRTLQQNQQAQWRILLLQANASQDTAAILSSLGQFLFPDSRPSELPLAIREFCARQKVVLLIDDAEQLSPGLLTELLEFCESVPELGLVLAISHDGFHIKRSTDKIIDDCHFIELQPLSRKECTEYLQNLSAQPGAGISFKAISDSLVTDLYRVSHGIPGRILVELPKVSLLHKRRTGNQSGVWLGLLLAAGSASGAWFWLNSAAVVQKVDSSARQSNVQTIAIPAPKPQLSNETVTATPVREQIKPENDNVAALSVHSNPAAPAPAPPKAEDTPAVKDLAASQPAPVMITTQPGPDTAKKSIEPKPQITAQLHDSLAWIMTQPADNYTLQVMVLYDQEAVNRVFKKYAVYRDNLKYFVNNTSNKHKYVVIYGSFPSITEAKKHKSLMPNEFNRSLEKRFKFVQTESR